MPCWSSPPPPKPSAVLPTPSASGPPARSPSSRPELGEDRLSAKKGCRNGVELLARITLASERTLTQRMRLGEATRPRSPSVGRRCRPASTRSPRPSAPARSATTVRRRSSSTLDPIRAGSGPERRARRNRPRRRRDRPPSESPLPFAADEVRGQARVWESVLDEDGLVPAEERAMQARASAPGSPGTGWCTGR